MESQLMTNEIASPVSLCRMSAKMKLTSNGVNAKTAKVSIVARSGEVIDIPGWGPCIHDFSGMSVKSKIPLDYEHDQTVGYLNNFDTSTGELVSSGVMVLSDIGGVDVNAIADQLLAGVPYQSSLEFSPDMVLEYVDEGLTTTVNGKEFVGPIYVIRQWILVAVAICKFGVDSDTDVQIQLSKNKLQENRKGFFVRLSNKEITMNDEKKVAAVEATPVEAKAVDAAVVEAKPVKATATPVTKEAPVKETTEVKEEVKAEAPEVEADKDEKRSGELEAVHTVVEGAIVPPPPESTHSLSKTVEAIDPRQEAKRFATKFSEKALEYFGEGLTYEQALEKHLDYVTEKNTQLSKQVKTIDRGGKFPLKFSEESIRGDVAAKNDEPNGLIKSFKKR